MVLATAVLCTPSLSPHHRHRTTQIHTQTATRAPSPGCWLDENRSESRRSSVPCPLQVLAEEQRLLQESKASGFQVVGVGWPEQSFLTAETCLRLLLRRLCGCSCIEPAHLLVGGAGRLKAGRSYCFPCSLSLLLRVFCEQMIRSPEYNYLAGQGEFH